MKDDGRFPKLVVEEPKVVIGGRTVLLPSDETVNNDPLNAMRQLRDSLREIAEMLTPKPPA